MSHSMKEVDYKCTTDGCGHTSTMRYFPDEPVILTLCCVNCRAGFGIEQREMNAGRIGMVIVGKPRMDHDEPKFRAKGGFTAAGNVA
jgi:hypothetical protein